MEEDVERQAVHGDPDIMEKKRKAKLGHFLWCITGTFMTVAMCGIVLAAIFQLNAHYYVFADSVSPDDDPTRGLSFNLTLGVSSASYGAKACIKPGTYLEVSYRGVQLATSQAEAGLICARPMKSVEQRVATRVTAVPVGPVLDSLVAEMRHE